MQICRFVAEPFPGEALGMVPNPEQDRFRHWGTTADEREAPWPCDGEAAPGEESLFRGIDVDAAPPLVFRWLCQLKVAPYSYDWLDNLGRQSPRRWTPGAEKLERGQRFMVLFELTDWVPDRSMTMSTRQSNWTGQVGVTYQTLLLAPKRTRLIARLRCRYPNHVGGRLMRLFLPAGDWIMMRKQFLTLKALAEESQRRAG